MKLVAVATLLSVAAVLHVVGQAQLFPATLPPSAPSVAPFAVFIMYQGELLSGGVTGCPTFNATTCVGGLAALSSYVRSLKRDVAAGKLPPTTFVEVPYVDRQSVFVQMHPVTWGINAGVMDALRYRNFFAGHTLFDEKRPGMEQFRLSKVMLASGNAYTRSTHPWAGTMQRWTFDDVDNPTFAVSHLFDELADNSDDVLAAVNAAVADLTLRRPNVTATVVVSWAAAPHEKLLKLAGIDNPPTVVTLERDITTPSNFSTRPLLINKTWFVLIDSVASALKLNITRNQVQGGVPSTTAAPTATVIDVAAIPSSLLYDDQWFEDQRRIAPEIRRAVSNDPVIGVVLTPMPQHRTGTFRLCMAGECPGGNLFNDGIRYTAGADISLTNSGGFRGDGWPAGNLRISQLFTMVPFANRVCTGTVMGLTLFDMLNTSFSLATYAPVLTPTGNHLLQMSGIRVVVDPFRNASAGRLLQVNVWNASSKSWEPLKRFSLYTFAVESFLCQSFQPYATLLARAKYPGEVQSKVQQLVMQDAVARAITATSPISHRLDGRILLVNNISMDPAPSNWSTASSLRWLQVQRDCESDFFFSSALDSCLPCPSGSHQPQSGQLACVSNDGGPPITLIVGALVASAVVCLILLAVIKVLRSGIDMVKVKKMVGFGVSILSQVADFGAGVAGCYVMWQAHGAKNPALAIAYTCLIVTTGLASAAEVAFLLFLFMHPESVDAYAMFGHRMTVAMAVTEDLPLIIVNAYSLTAASVEVTFLISLLVSTVLFGQKLASIPHVLKTQSELDEEAKVKESLAKLKADEAAGGVGGESNPISGGDLAVIPSMEKTTTPPRGPLARFGSSSLSPGNNPPPTSSAGDKLAALRARRAREKGYITSGTSPC